MSDTFDPSSWGHSEPALKWEVFPLGKKGQREGNSVYVTARNAERALACGKYWRRVLQFTRHKNVVARRYYPERDLSISTWVCKTPARAAS